MSSIRLMSGQAQLRVLAAAAAIGLAAPSWAVTVDNGSLTGPVANGGVPSGWVILAGSPDTDDVFNNVGSTGAGTFGATPSPSPDGGTWVGLGADSASGFVERFGQSISGLAVGSTYRVSWYAANFGYAPLSYINPAAIELIVDGSSQGFGASLALQPGWVAQSRTFTATATTELLAFGSSIGPRSYISIDGISVAAVPEPSPWAMTVGGILLIGGVLRRRCRAQSAA